MQVCGKIIISFCFILLFGSGCKDGTAIIDTFNPVNNKSWAYVNKFRYKVAIPDQKLPYNIFVNLRHTADYNYSNIFLLIRMKGPDNKIITERKEFKLALPDGEWLGKGSGNLYTYQLPFKENFYFAQKGDYFFEIEQNMRDNPLREVSDIGIRIEKAE